MVVYELDTPTVTTKVGSLTLTAGTKAALGGDFAATNPLATQAITAWQIYNTNAADTLTLSGAAQVGGHSATGALTVANLSAVGLTAGASPGSDTLEVRAFNGSYWGDWTALSVSVTAPLTVAQALTATGSFAVLDTAANVAANAAALQNLAAAGRLLGVSLSGGQLLSLTAAQFTTTPALRGVLGAGITLAVSGASNAQAASVQANAQVASFTITDTAADLVGQAPALARDGKLAGLAISGTTNGGTLSLAGLSQVATITLAADRATMSGLGTPTMRFLAAPDALVLGNGPASITVNPAAGLDTISNFQFGLDRLSLSGLSTLHATDTSVGGVHAIALTGADMTHGLVLLGEPTSVTAASLLAGHVSYAGGGARS